MIKAYQLRIELRHVKPSVWRRVVVPADITFKRLHDVMQFAMGWQDYHLYQFEVKTEGQKTVEISCDQETIDEFHHNYIQLLREGFDPDNRFDVYRAARLLQTEVKYALKERLPAYIEKMERLVYTYDFGDGWEHDIILEKIINDYPNGYPVLLDGEGACPPEDVGGSSGYEEFLKIWNDPSHPEHGETKVWGEGMSYSSFDLQNTNRLMENLLKLKRVKK